jgi:hypothetical protein
VNFLNTKFHENPFNGSRIYYTRADRNAEADRGIFAKFLLESAKIAMSSRKIA